MKLEWSTAALSDLDRFASFLHDRFPKLAGAIAQTILDKAEILSANPYVGHPLAGSQDFRQVVLRALNAAYVIQYRVTGDRIVILRVFHGREWRP